MVTTALLVWALIVAGLDLRSRRIPNGLLLAAAVPALAVFFFRDQGWLGQTLQASTMGMLVALLILLPGFLLKRLGGGDVKFAACCGWFLGTAGSGLMMLGMALMLGVLSVIAILFRRAEGQSMKRLPAGPSIAVAFIATLLLRPRWEVLL